MTSKLARKSMLFAMLAAVLVVLGFVLFFWPKSQPEQAVSVVDQERVGVASTTSTTSTASTESSQGSAPAAESASERRQQAAVHQPEGDREREVTIVDIFNLTKPPNDPVTASLTNNTAQELRLQARLVQRGLSPTDSRVEAVVAAARSGASKADLLAIIERECPGPQDLVLGGTLRQWIDDIHQQEPVRAEHTLGQPLVPTSSVTPK